MRRRVGVKDNNRETGFLSSLINWDNWLAHWHSSESTEMNIDENRSAEDRAWAIASDPSASENHWIAACTVLDGKRPSSSRTVKRLPQSVGLPWSLCISGLSGLGAFMIFGFLSAAVCEAASAVTGAFYTFTTPHAFALLSAAFIAFSAVFTYQQHIWGGGRVWSTLHYGLVACGALLPFSIELLVTSPASVGNLSLFSLWGVGFIGVSALSTRLTQNSIKSLEGSVGANRVMPHSRTMFATAGALLLGLAAVPATFTVVASMWFWLPVLLIGSGFYIASANRAHNQQTAATLAFAVWNPLILANLVLLPALMTYSVATLFLPQLQITLADYGIGLVTMACLVLGPLLGAKIGARMLQRSRELELHHAPQELLAQSSMPTYRLDAEETVCEST